MESPENLALPRVVQARGSDRALHAGGGYVAFLRNLAFPKRQTCTYGLCADESFDFTTAER